MVNMNLDAVPLMRPGVPDVLVRSLGSPALATARHRDGLLASANLEKARSMVARYLGGEDSEVTFVSSASEANTWALWGARFSGGKSPDHLLVSPLEHVSVINSAKGLREQKKVSVTFLRLDRKGSIDLDWMKENWPEGKVLVSVQRANPETGIVQPIEEIGALVQEMEGIFHTDFSAAEGWESPEFSRRPIDIATVSSAAIGGPAGIAALWVRRGIRMVPLIYGGAQENGHRGGSQPVFLAEAFGAAVHHAGLSLVDEKRKFAEIDLLIQTHLRTEFPSVTLVGASGARREGILNLLVPEVDGQALLSLMDREGVIVGTGSSCSSQSLKVSHVLTALGYSAREAQGSIVLSLGWWNELADVNLWGRALMKGMQALSRLKAV